MIRKVEMYQALCDNCGKACINEDICAWSEESQAMKMLFIWTGKLSVIGYTVRTALNTMMRQTNTNR